MAHDPNFSHEHFATAAANPNVGDQSNGESEITEQFLLSLIRFVQYGTSKSQLTPVESMLLTSAKDVFSKLAKECDVSAKPKKPQFASKSMTSRLKPLSGKFLDQSVTDWPESGATTAAKKSTTKRKSTKKKTTKKKSRKRSSKKKTTT